jgi:G:T-mismatch repair DNA endonuclease (very short patch repair protein)
MKKAVKGAKRCRELGLAGHPTKPEKDMEIALAKYGIQYIPQYDFKIGIMDFYLPDGNIALFVDGEVWHADPSLYNPNDIMFFGKNSFKDKKYAKITAKEIWNKNRQQNAYLESIGFKVLRFWEKEITDNIDNCIQTITKSIELYTAPY